MAMRHGKAARVPLLGAFGRLLRGIDLEGILYVPAAEPEKRCRGWK